MSTKSDTNTSDSGGASSRSEPQGVGVMGLALELLRSDEKSAADREAKLAVLRFIATITKGHTEDYVKGYTTGYTEGFRDGYTLRVTEEETEGHKYGE